MTSATVVPWAFSTVMPAFLKLSRPFGPMPYAAMMFGFRFRRLSWGCPLPPMCSPVLGVVLMLVSSPLLFNSIIV